MGITEVMSLKLLIILLHLNHNKNLKLQSNALRKNRREQFHLQFFSFKSEILTSFSNYWRVCVLSFRWRIFKEEGSRSLWHFYRTNSFIYFWEFLLQYGYPAIKYSKNIKVQSFIYSLAIFIKLNYLHTNTRIYEIMYAEKNPAEQRILLIFLCSKQNVEKY